MFVHLVETHCKDVFLTFFFFSWKPRKYSAMMLKLCGKVALLWVLRESLNAILVILYSKSPLVKYQPKISPTWAFH